MTTPQHVWCDSCRWRGKRVGRVDPDPDEGREDEPDYGGCPRCSTALRRGQPPKGGTVGRPPLTVAQRLRRKAAELVAMADELERG